jgi:cell division protease FtsH
MVTEFGMSDAVGAINYASQKRSRFLEVGLPSEGAPLAEDTARLIDDEVRRIVTDSHALARRILNERRDRLELVTRRLLEKEVMEGDELRAILAEGAPATAN